MEGRKDGEGRFDIDISKDTDFDTGSGSLSPSLIFYKELRPRLFIMTNG